MNNADEALLILLAVVLAILIILLIWAAIYLLKILSITKRVVSDAEKLVDSAEAVSQAFKKASGPVAVIRLIHGLSEAVNKRRGGR